MHDSITLPLSRRRIIAERLGAGQPVTAATLAAEFGVSEDAIRRDLRALAQDGLCQRVYGGALPLSPAVADFPVRLTQGAARKQALARAALGLIAPQMTIFLDAGSTVLHLAQMLPALPGLRVVTNSVPAAAALAARADLAVFVLGGAMSAQVGACVDPQAHAALARYRIDLCFLGACALSVQDGLAGFDMADVEFKRRLVEVSQSTALMMTNDKLETRAPFAIAPVAAIADLVLEADAPPAVLARLPAPTRLHLAAAA